MSNVVRYEFMGNWVLFWFLFISGVGTPFAILYLLDGTLRLQTMWTIPRNSCTRTAELAELNEPNYLDCTLCR